MVKYIELIEIPSKFTFSSFIIQVTTLPLSKDIKGGFVIPEIELSKSKLREDVLEANFYASRVIFLNAFENLED